MKRAFMLVLVFFAISMSADELQVHPLIGRDVIHVATALDHLTVLEFGEPVTLAAAGSAAFQIERHEDKVFIKPLKAGASTNLFVWTASRRFAYELEAAGEVKNMNFAVDSRAPKPKSAADSSPKLEDVADMILTRAFLGVERVQSSNIKDEKNRITLRIEQVLQANNTLYIHYSLRNLSTRPYRAVAPAVSQVLAPRAKISVTALEHMQLDGKLLRKLGELKERPLAPSRCETEREDIRPGEETQGVVSIRGQIASPAIFRLTFDADRSRPVAATVVF
jgi:hypothetical protein